MDIEYFFIYFLSNISINIIYLSRLFSFCIQTYHFIMTDHFIILLSVLYFAWVPWLLCIYETTQTHTISQTWFATISQQCFLEIHYFCDIPPALLQFYLFRFAVSYYIIRVRPWNKISFSRPCRCGFHSKRCWAFVRRRKRERLRALCFNQYMSKIESRYCTVYLNIPEHVGANCHAI